MRRIPFTDPFAALMPGALSQMPVAWQQLRIPAPPRALKLSGAEQSAKTPETKFARRTIQRLVLSREAGADSRQSAAAEPMDQLALIDKASPHALYDLMLSEVSPQAAGQPLKPDPTSVGSITGRVLWQTAANFQRFVSNPEVRREFELSIGQETRTEEAPEDQRTGRAETIATIPSESLGRERQQGSRGDSGNARSNSGAQTAAFPGQRGWLQMALNCDPNTSDRESVQALKSFHLHLIYWRPSELGALTQTDRLLDQHNPYLMRQCLDPLSFIGPRLLNDRLTDLEPQLATIGAVLLPADAEATCAGWRPMGSLIQLPSWTLLATPDFERLIRQLHRRLTATAAALLRAVTNSAHPPAPWQRHRLLPLPQIARNLTLLGLSDEVRAELLALVQQLRDLPPPVAQSLRRASPSRRMHCMTLNQPCYSLSLSPMDALGRSTMGANGPLLLSLQIKLFSGIGGAGLISLPGLPSVRVLRAQGQFSEADWQRRADFQRRFAAYNTAALIARDGGEIGYPPERLDRRPEVPTGTHPGGPSSGIRQSAFKGRLHCGPLGQFQSETGWTH